MSIRISDDIESIDREKLAAFLMTTLWQADIGSRTLQRALQNSICISAFEDSEQVGFARVVTDKATFCWIDDVFVDANFRGRGIATKMLQAILAHRDLRSVASWFLATGNADARSVFSRAGFAELAEDRSARLMARPKVQNADYAN